MSASASWNDSRAGPPALSMVNGRNRGSRRPGRKFTPIPISAARRIISAISKTDSLIRPLKTLVRNRFIFLTDWNNARSRAGMGKKPEQYHSMLRYECGKLNIV